MAAIIEHMTLFTRRSDGSVFELTRVDEVIQNSFKLCGQQLRNHGIEVATECDPSLPEILGDPIRLEQVLTNLITNARIALQSTSKEEKLITVRALHREADQSVSIEVADNGPGIPAAIRAKIFQPFFTTREPGKGTGLGLSVATRIVEEHQGRIELESQEGQGTLFRVVLPRRKAA
jgi:hypothetical protein